jgi:hypothetical protein
VRHPQSSRRSPPPFLKPSDALLSPVSICFLVWLQFLDYSVLVLSLEIRLRG